MTCDDFIRACAASGIHATALGHGHVDLGRTPCDGEYAVRAQVNADGSCTVHVLTHGETEPTAHTEYGTYDWPGEAMRTAYNILHD